MPERQSRAADPGSPGLALGGPSEDEHPLAAVGCSGVGSGYNRPPSVIPETGQRPENGTDSPNKSSLMPLASSHRPAAESHDASGPGGAASRTVRIPFRDRNVVLVLQPLQEVQSHIPGGFCGKMLIGRLIAAGGQETANVLDDHKAWPKCGYGAGDLNPHAGARALTQPGPLPSCRHVLAREARAQHIYGVHAGPVHGGDVAQVWHGGEVVGEDLRRVRVIVGHPCQFAAEHGFHGHAKALVARAERADAIGHRSPPGGGIRAPGPGTPRPPRGRAGGVPGVATALAAVAGPAAGGPAAGRSWGWRLNRAS